MRHEDGTKAYLALDQRDRLLQLAALILLVTTTDDAASSLFVTGATAGAGRPLAPTTHLTLRGGKRDMGKKDMEKGRWEKGTWEKLHSIGKKNWDRRDSAWHKGSHYDTDERTRSYFDVTSPRCHK